MNIDCITYTDPDGKYHHDLFVLEDRKKKHIAVFVRKLSAVYEHCKQGRRSGVKMRDASPNRVDKYRESGYDVTLADCVVDEYGYRRRGEFDL